MTNDMQSSSAAASPKPLSVSIVTFNSQDEIVELLHSMQTHVDLSQVEVFVIDNASTDATVAQIEQKFPWVTLIKNQDNIGFGAAHNRVLEQLESIYHVVINPDIVFLEDALNTLACYLASNTEVAIVVPRLLNQNGTEQHLPKLLPKPRYVLARRLFPNSKRGRRLNSEYTRSDEEFESPTVIENASGSFFMVRTSTYKQLQGFDPRFFMYFEDNDLSKRAAEFGQIVFYPHTAVVHGYERASTKSPKAFAQLLRSAVRYFRKHGLR